MKDPKNKNQITRRQVLYLGGAGVVGTLVGCSNTTGSTTDAAVDGGGSDGSPPADGGTLADRDPSLDAAMDAAPDAGPDAAPDATVEPELAPPLFFIHASDVHIGSGGFALAALPFFLDEALPYFDVLAVLVTGDLVEVGNNLDAWEIYRTTLDDRGLSADTFIENPGNHDSLLDGPLQNYLTNTLAGRNGHGTYGLYHIGTGSDLIRIVALNTVSDGNPFRDSTGYLTESHVDQLLAEIAADPRIPRETVILGHHPIDTANGLQLFGTDAHLERLIADTGAVTYLYGHVHIALDYWFNNTLMSQASTLGNPSSGTLTTHAAFSVLALDDGPVTKNVPLLGDSSSLSIAWPVVMITRPANPTLGLNNPLVTNLPRATPGQILRAGVFSPSAPSQVTFSLDQGTPQPMTLVGNYYEAEFTTPDAGTCEIEVYAATSDGTASDTITINLA